MGDRIQDLRWWLEDHLRLVIMVLVGLVLLVAGFFTFNFFMLGQDATSNTPSAAESPTPFPNPTLDAGPIPTLYVLDTPECKASADTFDTTPYASWTELVTSLRSYQAACAKEPLSPTVSDALFASILRKSPLRAAPEPSSAPDVAAITRCRDDDLALSGSLTPGVALEDAATRLDALSTQCPPFALMSPESFMQLVRTSLLSPS